MVDGKLCPRVADRNGLCRQHARMKPGNIRRYDHADALRQVAEQPQEHLLGKVDWVGDNYSQGALEWEKGDCLYDNSSEQHGMAEGDLFYWSASYEIDVSAVDTNKIAATMIKGLNETCRIENEEQTVADITEYLNELGLDDPANWEFGQVGDSDLWGVEIEDTPQIRQDTGFNMQRIADLIK